MDRKAVGIHAGILGAGCSLKLSRQVTASPEVASCPTTESAEMTSPVKVPASDPVQTEPPATEVPLFAPQGEAITPPAGAPSEPPAEQQPAQVEAEPPPMLANTSAMQSVDAPPFDPATFAGMTPPSDTLGPTVAQQPQAAPPATPPAEQPQTAAKKSITDWLPFTLRR